MGAIWLPSVMALSGGGLLIAGSLEGSFFHGLAFGCGAGLIYFAGYLRAKQGQRP